MSGALAAPAVPAARHPDRLARRASAPRLALRTTTEDGEVSLSMRPGPRLQRQHAPSLHPQHAPCTLSLHPQHAPCTLSLRCCAACAPYIYIVPGLPTLRLTPRCCVRRSACHSSTDPDGPRWTQMDPHRAGGTPDEGPGGGTTEGHGGCTPTRAPKAAQPCNPWRRRLQPCVTHSIAATLRV